MIMENDEANIIQWNLYLITLDGYCPADFLEWPRHNVGVDPKKRWQFAVDMIYCCIKSGLMTVWNEGWMKSVGVGCADNFALVLAKNDPFDQLTFRERGAVFWLEPLLCSTDFCKNLLRKFGVVDENAEIVCEPLIEEIERIFASHNLSLGRKPLILVAEK
jgi:hypothetical protein